MKTQTHDPSKPTLRRELRLFDVTVAGVGIILGAGIYALIGIAASDAGNATWLSFFFGSFVAMFTGLSYAELSSFSKGDAGEYDYCKKAFGKSLSWFVAILVIFTGVIAAATVSLGFAGYAFALFGTPFLVTALLLVLLMSLINFLGIRLSNRFNLLATGMEFLGLLIIILLGIPKWGSVDLTEMPHGMDGVFQASALVFFVLAMQCLPTLAVTRREAGGTKYAVLQLGYMSGVAYIAAFVVFQSLTAMGIS